MRRASLEHSENEPCSCFWSKCRPEAPGTARTSSAARATDLQHGDRSEQGIRDQSSKWKPHMQRSTPGSASQLHSRLQCLQVSLLMSRKHNQRQNAALGQTPHRCSIAGSANTATRARHDRLSNEARNMRMRQRDDTADLRNGTAERCPGCRTLAGSTPAAWSPQPRCWRSDRGRSSGKGKILVAQRESACDRQRRPAGTSTAQGKRHSSP
jgi:hypothetical protein